VQISAFLHPAFERKSPMIARLFALAALAGGMAIPAATPRAESNAPAVRMVVDAREFPRHVLHSTLNFPVSPGPLTLYYPKWIPGTHRAEGPIENLTGISMSANGKPVPWVRDTLDYFTFHCTVPSGAHDLEVKLDMLEPPSSHELGSLVWSEV